MTQFHDAQVRDTILFVNDVRSSTADALRHYEKRFGKKISGLVIVDQKHEAKFRRDFEAHFTPTDRKLFKIVTCSFESAISVKQALAPYAHCLLAVTAQHEKNIPALGSVIPHVPYLNTPTAHSLEWATDKIQMRNMLYAHNKAISPRFAVVRDALPETVARVAKKVGFPLIVKPAGLAQSLLVTVCYHEDELAKALQVTTKKLERVYKESRGRGVPKILVEQFMEGSMYSVDVYVNARGQTYSTPLVHVKTGRAIGFDDFFGYQRITPVKLLQHKQQAGQSVAEEGVKALGLRSVTAHVELMKVEGGWKIIELAPRMGGFRDKMYMLSYGIDHSLNDFLIRIPQKPIIPKKRRGYTVVLHMYPKQEGRLDKIVGLKKVRALESFHEMTVKKKKGDMSRFARYGGTYVLEIALFNKERSKLLADIRRIEKTVEIIVEPRK